MNCFFVGGSQRSGTNLLNTILCQDPATNPMVHEAQYLTRLLSVFGWASQNFDNNTHHYFADGQTLRDFHGVALQRLLDNMREQHGTENLVLKDPDLTRHFPALDELVQPCRFLCMVRNPWDTIASMVKVGQRLAAQGAQQFEFFAARDIARLCAHYNSYYAPVLTCADPGFRSRVMLLRYEDLVSRPTSVLQRLREFTGLALAEINIDGDFDTGNIDYSTASPAWQPWITEHYGRRVSDERIHSFTKVLTADEVKTVSAHCADMIKLFEYRL